MIYTKPWTNLILLMAIKSVLCAALGAGAGDAYVNVSRVRRTPQPHHSHRSIEDEDQIRIWKQSYWRHMQDIMRAEGSSKKGTVECCPSVVEMIAPKGGRDSKGLYVELYVGDGNRQQLYELACLPEVEGKPCRFIDPRLYNHSRCVQKYSYSYALVRHVNASEKPPHRHRREGHFSMSDLNSQDSEGWSLDYVMVRSGCECEVTPQLRNVKNSHTKPTHKRHRPRNRSKRRMEEVDKT